MSYDPALNLVYYGSGNPSTWNPKQRPGDNKWSMTIFARNPDTGLARWVYQMTPHDEWDYDGVNEMILSDQQVGGAERKLLTHFDRNGLGYTLDRGHRRIAGGRQVRSEVNWTSGVDMNKSSPTYGPAQGSRSILDRQAGRGPQQQGDLPGGARHQGRTAGGLFAGHPAVLRADQPRLHGLRAVQGELHRGPALCRGDAVDVSAFRRDPHGNFIAGTARPARSPGRTRSSSRSGSGALATAVAWCSNGTLEGYLKAVDAKTGKELYKFKTPSGIIGNVTTMSRAAGSTWRYCPALAAGRASALRPV